MSEQRLTTSAASKRDLPVQTDPSLEAVATHTDSKMHLEAAKVEDLVHQFQVILHRVNDLWRSVRIASRGHSSHDAQ